MAVVGIVQFFFLGVEVPLLEGSTLDRGGLVNDAKVVGVTVQRSRKMKESMVNLKVALGDGGSLDTYFPRDVEGESQFETDTGQTYTIDPSFVTDSQKISGGGGGVDVTIGGGEAVEVLAS